MYYKGLHLPIAGLPSESAVSPGSSRSDFLRRGTLPTSAIRRPARARTKELDEAEVELLAAILSPSRARARMRTLSARMIDTYGSFAKVMSAPARDVARIDGANDNHAATIKAAFTTIMDTVYTCARESKSFDYHWIIAYILWEIGMCTVEKVQLIYLDKQNKMIGSEIICSGSESFVAVSVREVILAVCNRNAAAFFIAHNHPGGSVQPSENDRLLTTKLMQAAAIMGIQIIDSIIASDNGWFSFRDNGYL
jgi:DNA repair protein RadC